MQLIYRNQAFEYQPQPLKSYRYPCAINWRYAVSGESHQQKMVKIRPYHLPKAINWRWQPLP